MPFWARCRSGPEVSDARMKAISSSVSSPPIQIVGSALLRKRAKPVGRLDAELRSLTETLITAMFAHDGLGLAAPQLGFGWRMIALNVPRPQDDATRAFSPGEAFLLPRMPLVIINPEILDRSTATATRDEGCLSVPDIYAPVTRPVRIVLRARLSDEAEFTLECDGLLARALQHEIDHLDGILFIDRLDATELGKIKPRLNRLRREAAKTDFRRMAPA